MRNYDPFHGYAQALVSLGHDRYWIMHNEPALRERFARDPQPFPPPPPPIERPRERYDEL